MPRFDDFTSPAPGLYTFTGAGSPAVTLTGPVAEQEAARIAAQRPAPAPLALTGMASGLEPVASSAPVTRSDAVPDYSPPPMGPNGLPGASVAAPRADALDNPLNAPPEPIASVAPREEVVSRVPEASFASDGPAHRPVSGRIGPGHGQGGGAPLDASGGFGSVANALGMQRLLAPSGGGRTTPAHWQATSRATSATDGRVGAIPMAGALGAVGAAGSAAEAARQEGDQVDAQRLAKEAEIEAATQEKIAARHAEAQAERQDTRSAMKKIMDQAAEPDIDPNKWWSEKSTGQTILLALASGAIGMSNGKAGIAGNPMLQSIERSMERDVENQVRNRDAKEKSKAQKYGMLGQTLDLARQELGDDVAAMNVTKGVGYTIAQKRLQATALAADSPLAKARADAAFAAIDQRKAELILENERRLQVTKQGNEAWQPARTSGGGPDKLKLAMDLARFNKEFAPTNKPGESRGTASIGETTFQLDPNIGEAEAGVVRRAAVALDQGMKAAADVKRLRGTGLGFNDPDVVHAIDRMAYSDALVTGQGQANKDQVEAAQAKWRGLAKEKGVDYAIETFEADAGAFRKQYGKK